MERKSESDVRRLQHSKNDVKWLPSWWIMHLFTMRYISSPEFLVCVSIVDFWFAVILKFWYKSLYVYEIVLSCWSLNCKFIATGPAFVPTSSHDFWFRWHNCVRMILCLYCIYTFTGEPCHLWCFRFLLEAFSFLPREVPLVFVVKLV